MADLDYLAQLATEATSGPWVFATDKGPPDYVQLFSTSETDEYEADILSAAADDVLISEANANYIAAANPSVVLALVEVARAAQAFTRPAHRMWTTAEIRLFDATDALAKLDNLEEPNE